MRRRFTLVALVVLGFSAVLAARAKLVIDQEVLPATGTEFTYAVHIDQALSQTVTAGVSGRLWAVNVPIGCADGELILEIRDVDPLTGQPGPTLLNSTTFGGDQLPGGPLTGEYRSLKVRGRPVRLEAGDTFAFSLSNPTGTCGIWPADEGDGYSAGQGWWWSNQPPFLPFTAPLAVFSLPVVRDDLPFQTIMQVR